jgi:SAM-dependent methyltransferase
MERIRIDLGCGTKKQPGFIGLDHFGLPGVDHVLDLTADPFPFDDESVDSVFSSHFIEHIEEPNHVFEEIGRVCRDGARIEFWTPYAWTNEAFLFGHLHFISEEMWNHLGVSHRDAYVPMLKGRWLLRRFIYVVHEDVIADLARRSIDLDFAVRYFKGVVHELGVEIEFRRDLDVPAVVPERVYATTREAPRKPLGPAVLPPVTAPVSRRLMRKGKHLYATARARIA